MFTAVRGQWPITRDLPLLRQDLQAFAARAGLPTDRLHNLLLTANEAASTLIDSGSHNATLTVWTDDTGVNLTITDPRGSLAYLRADGFDTSRASSPDMLAQTVIQSLCHVVSQHRDHRGSRVHPRLLLMPRPSAPRCSPDSRANSV